MQTRIRNVLKQRHAATRALGEQVQAPASAEALDSLHDCARRELHAVLPQTYVDFLHEAAVLDFNGTVIYSTRQRALRGRLALLGFPESNRAFLSAERRHRVLFGETGGE